MGRDSVEVIVRFADTVVEVAHVDAERSYHIGTAPDVDFAIVGHTSFPLVDRGRLRIPLGVPALSRGSSTWLQVGHVTFQIRRVASRRTRVARKRPDWRPPAYLAASLLAHLLVWLVALVVEPFEVLVDKPQPRLRYAHLGEPPPEEAPATVVAAGTTSEPARHAMGARRADDAASIEKRLGREIETIAKRLGNTDALEAFANDTSRELYDEDAANARGFGGASGHFDPSQREGWGTVAAGDYMTFPFDVKLCPEKSCTIAGPFPADGVRSYLHAFMPAIYDCYTRYASGPGTIVLEFTIMHGDGSVHDARGHGLGETAACAARVVAAIDFKALDADTHVRYPIRFN